MYDKIEIILDILNRAETRIDGSFDKVDINPGFDLTPLQYVSFAEEDLLSKSLRSQVNALSNLKRALDCQIETMLFGFGLHSEQKKSNWNFPAKLKILNELDIIAPRILHKITKSRNLMEHEFHNPSFIEVHDFCDIVALFLAATDKYVNDAFIYKKIWNEKMLSDYNLFDLVVNIDFKNSTIINSLTYYDLQKKEFHDEELKISSSNSKYSAMLKGFFKVDRFTE